MRGLSTIGKVFTLGNYGRNHRHLRRFHWAGMGSAAAGAATYAGDLMVGHMEPLLTAGLLTALLPASMLINLAVFLITRVPSKPDPKSDDLKQLEGIVAEAREKLEKGDLAGVEDLVQQAVKLGGSKEIDEILITVAERRTLALDLFEAIKIAEEAGAYSTAIEGVEILKELVSTEKKAEVESLRVDLLAQQADTTAVKRVVTISLEAKDIVLVTEDAAEQIRGFFNNIRKNRHEKLAQEAMQEGDLAQLQELGELLASKYAITKYLDIVAEKRQIARDLLNKIAEVEQAGDFFEAIRGAEKLKNVVSNDKKAEVDKMMDHLAARAGDARITEKAVTISLEDKDIVFLDETTSKNVQDYIAQDFNKNKVDTDQLERLQCELMNILHNKNINGAIIFAREKMSLLPDELRIHFRDNLKPDEKDLDPSRIKDLDRKRVVVTYFYRALSDAICKSDDITEKIRKEVENRTEEINTEILKIALVEETSALNALFEAMTDKEEANRYSEMEYMALYEELMNKAAGDIGVSDPVFDDALYFLMENME